MDPTPTLRRRRGPTPRPRTLDKIEQVEQLIREGWGVLPACDQVGLDGQTWYRHTRRLTTDEQTQQLCLDVLRAICQQVAA